jgi:hypothetical protein
MTIEMPECWQDLPQRLALDRGCSRMPLPDGTREPLEWLFGADLSDVRVVVGPAAAAMGARAFAIGHEVHFAPGAYEPHGPAGREVLAHELTHVLQQRCGLAGRHGPHDAALLDDPVLEAQACALGTAAREMNARSLRTHALALAWRGAPPRPLGHAVQCLMALDEFKRSSNAPGMRDKIKKVDAELGQFHQLDAAVPRNYQALLAQLRKLFKTCQDYGVSRPDSKRKAGVDLLMRQVSAEEVVLSALADFEKSADVLVQWEHLEAAQERFLQLRGREHFTRKGFASELDTLIQNHRHKLEQSPAGAQAILKDVEELKRIAQRHDLPDVLAAVVHEVTSAGTMQQLSMGSVYSAGAKYNTTRGVQPKFTLNHNLNQGSGRKIRIGSLLHELTHVSVAETYGNTILMLAIDPGTDDKAMLQLAARRKARLLGLKDEIERASDLEPDLLSELRSKVGYPLCGKFGTYVSNFKSQLSQPVHDRLKALNVQGMDCELIEYDSVVNQMAMWCHLYGVDRGHAVYRQLLTLAKIEFDARGSQRSTRRRVVNPVGGTVLTRTPGRRMSVG